jgi:hypothetical protein
MAAREGTVTLEFNAELVERARAVLGLATESDSTVVERVLNAYLVGRLLNVTQARAGLSDQEAERLGVRGVGCRAPRARCAVIGR